MSQESLRRAAESREHHAELRSNLFSPRAQGRKKFAGRLIVDDEAEGRCHIEPKRTGLEGLLRLPVKKSDPQSERETLTGVLALAGAVLLFAVVGLAIAGNVNLGTEALRLVAPIRQAVGL